MVAVACKEDQDSVLRSIYFQEVIEDKDGWVDRVRTGGMVMKVKQKWFKTIDDPEAVSSLLPFQQDQHELHNDGILYFESIIDGSLRE